MSAKHEVTPFHGDIPPYQALIPDIRPHPIASPHAHSAYDDFHRTELEERVLKNMVIEANQHAEVW